MGNQGAAPAAVLGDDGQEGGSTSFEIPNFGPQAN